MQTAEEILAAIKNMEYYSDKVYNLCKQQFDLDYEKSLELGINVGAGTTRFDSLGAIGCACSMISTYLRNIRSNLETAIKQDKVLYINEEEEK